MLITLATVDGVGQRDDQSTDILPVDTNVLVKGEIQGQSNARIHEEAAPSEIAASYRRSSQIVKNHLRD
jgi:hypothetical protein